MGEHKWQADCPCAGHDTPQKHLSVEDDGTKALAHCFGNHTYEDICAALDYDSLTYDKPAAAEATTPKRIVATYDYKDESGNLLYQTVRYDPKDFRQRRRDGNGKWIWNLKDTRLVLYHLPDIKQLMPKGLTVWIVEGEKDADSLWERGIIATTNPLGAGKWRAEYSEMLRGVAKAIICGDNDSAGTEHIKMVMESLVSAGITTYIATVPAPAKDITEWCSLDGDIFALGNIGDNAIPAAKWKPPHNTTPPATRDRESPASLGSIRALLESTTGWISHNEVDNELGIRSSDEKHLRRMSLYRLRQDHLIETDPLNDRRIRWIHSEQSDQSLLDGIEAPPLPITMPLDIHTLVPLTPRSIVVVAAFTGVGKTTFMLNVAHLNLTSMPILYAYSEGSIPSFRKRVRTAWPNEYPEPWDKPRWLYKSDFYSDAIIPDNINIIDWLGKSGEFWTVGRDVAGVYNRLVNGVAFIAMQKNENATLPVGGRFAIENADLYITLDKTQDYYKATIRKARQWVDDTVNPVGLCRYFKIHSATIIEPTTHWEPEPAEG